MKSFSSLDANGVRLVGVSAGFMAVGVFGSLPILLLRLVDRSLGLDPFSQLAEKLRRGIAWFLLDLAGVSVGVLEGPEGKESCFKESCVLLTFSHASNIDGHLVSSTCPIRHYALAKKELFVVPFFSWISLAFGGIPVDRNNRDRAVKALRRASDAAKDSRICVVVAPEGTRSTTGQLLSFKKGD
jgi:1-acyl-sn-glycerol-3-phosphate acyltransferase